MTNIITALTYTLLLTNWYPVEQTQHEVEIVTRQTHLQYGTNTFLLSTEDSIGPGGLRKREFVTLRFTTNSAPQQWWILPGVSNVTNLTIPAPDVKPDRMLQLRDGIWLEPEDLLPRSTNGGVFQ